MVIILIPQGLTKLSLKVNILNCMKEEKLSVKITPLNKKRKASSIEETSNSKGKGKEIATKPHQPSQSCIV